MDLLIVAVVCLLAIAITTQFSQRLGVASPLLLLVIGTACGFLPAVPAITIAPDIILQGVLPLLLFATAATMPAQNFRREIWIVSVLAVSLVGLTAVVLGYFLAWIIPELSLPWAIALGAILSPTDAVAISIAKRIGVSSRIIAILDGEGLFNDASSLVLLGAATTAAVSGRVSFGAVAWDFLVAIGVAILIGFLVGHLMLMVGSRFSDPSAQTVLTITVPFLAAVPAEHLGGSGLVAAVVAGIVTGYHSPRMVSPQARVATRHTWGTIVFILEGGIFLFMGLAVFGIVEAIKGSSYGMGYATMVALIAGALTVLVRAVVISPTLWLTQRHYAKREVRAAEVEQAYRNLYEKCAQAAGEKNPQCVSWAQRSVDFAHYREAWSALGLSQRRIDRFISRLRRREADLGYYQTHPLGVREGAVLVWAGMRGAVTLAAAQTLPEHTPQRPVLLLIAILVAAGSLLIQGLTLEWVIKVVKPRTGHESDAADEAKIMQLLAETASTALAVDGVRLQELRAKLWSAQDVDSADEAGFPAAPSYAMSEAGQQRLLAIIRAQREAVLDARDEALFNGEAIAAALRQLDVQELTVLREDASL